MQDLLSGRGAIVTGGARGIGLAVAQTLGLLGARVLIVDNGAALDGGPEDPAVTELAAQRVPGAIGLALDVAADGAAQHAVERAVSEFGALDLVVDAAAIEIDARIGEASRADFERVLRTNLVGPFALASAAVPAMRAQSRGGRRPGAFVAMGSACAQFGRAGRVAEAASKAGLVAMVRTLAHELAELRISCNAVVPFAGTRAVRAMPGDTPREEAYRARTMSLAASHVAHLVAFLGAPQSAGITGQLFGVRGREVFVWTASRPAASCFQPRAFDADEFAQALRGLRRDFADLSDDLDAFDDEPVA
ncbi:MAG TPA: SDR family oxidoreductase [Burkholderiaceae bacterium]|nr:SDR family oxidoreductase [Burkholderiaceae bacterium]